AKPARPARPATVMATPPATPASAWPARLSAPSRCAPTAPTGRPTCAPSGCARSNCWRKQSRRKTVSLDSAARSRLTLRRDPDDPDVWTDRATLHFTAARYDDAQADFIRARQADASNGHVVLWLYFARVRLGRAEAMAQLASDAASLQWKP